MFYVTEKQIEKLDATAVKQGLQIRQMMELAGWHMVEVFKRLKISKKSFICIVVGVGNKGGDGLSAARYLVNNGWDVGIIMMRVTNLSSDLAHHLNLLNKMNIPIISWSKNQHGAACTINQSAVIIDALIGYHLKGTPRGIFKEVIELINSVKKAKVIAYDIPSGMDATTGQCYEPCIQAYATLTLALPKKAFTFATAKKRVGRLFLGDIGIPDLMYNKVNKNSRPDFYQGNNGVIAL